MKLYSLCILNILAVLAVSKAIAIEQIHPDVRRFAEQAERAEQTLQRLQSLVAQLNRAPQHQPHYASAAQSDLTLDTTLLQPQHITLPEHISMAQRANAPARQALRLSQELCAVAIFSSSLSLLWCSEALISQLDITKKAAMGFVLFPPAMTTIGALLSRNQICVNIPHWKAWTVASLSFMGLNAMVWRHAYLASINRY